MITHTVTISMKTVLLLLATAVAVTTATNQLTKRSIDEEEAIVQYADVLSRLLEKVRAQGELENLLDNNLEEAVMEADIQKKRQGHKKKRKGRRRDDDDDDEDSSSSSDDQAEVEQDRVLALVQDLISGLMW